MFTTSSVGICKCQIRQNVDRMNSMEEIRVFRKSYSQLATMLTSFHLIPTQEKLNSICKRARVLY